MSDSASYNLPLTTAGGMPTMAEVPCQNCGRMVSVMLPFYGCVFCSDCQDGGSYSAMAEEFFKRSHK